jgi:KipI family sensor histidine kinase inhibitor
MTELVPLGDRAYLARFAREDEAVRWAAAVRQAKWANGLEVVTAYFSVGVYCDAERAGIDELESRLSQVVPTSDAADVAKIVQLPVLYDGVDLSDVARRLSLTEAEVVASHSSQDYRVFAIGFLPGFPYAGYLPAALSGLPRRDSPRTRVPAGSVAIVGRQTGVYPSESPGGWHLIGRTPLSIVDVESGRFPIRAGDRLQFVPIDSQEFAARRGEPL